MAQIPTSAPSNTAAPVATISDKSSAGKGVRDMFEESKPFFPQNSAATTYAKETSFSDSLRVGIFDEEVGVRKPTPKPVATMNAVFPWQMQNQAQPTKQYTSDAERILDTYGDPNKDAPIEAIKEAPKPFRAMMEAVQTGEKNLAFGYARQYVRHIKNIQQRTNDIMAMTDVAMEREGLKEEVSPEDPNYDSEYRRIMEKDLEKVRGQSKDGLYVSSLMPEVNALLNAAKEAEGTGRKAKGDDSKLNREKELALESGYERGFDETKARAKIRKSLYGKVPVDPQGQAKLYFFFNPYENKSESMAREVEILNKKNAGSKRLQVEGITSQQMNAEQIEAFTKGVNISFPIQVNPTLFAKLGIVKQPALMLLSPNTKQYVLEDGFRPYYYLDELVKAVQGSFVKE